MSQNQNTFDACFDTYISPIQGWCNRDELECLFNLSCQCNHPSIEIGAFCGRSTAAICMGRETLKTIETPLKTTHIVVDHFVCSNPDAPKDIKATFLFNMQQLNLKHTKIDLHPVSSETAWHDLKDLRADLLFLDGNHTFEAVTRDMDLYAPLVRPDGWLLLHDCYGKFEQEVCRAADKWLDEHPNNFIDSEKIKSMRILKHIAN